MCIRTNTPPALVCTIGDLLPGTVYDLPNGDTFMVLDLPRSADSRTVVNLRTGRITPVYSSTKLGFDQRGRLYASTFLNGWYAPVDEDAATTWLPPGGYDPE